MSNYNSDKEQAYPLAWPSHVRRTPSADRAHARFAQRSNSGWDKSLTLYQARMRLDEEIRLYTRTSKTWRIDPDGVILSTNLVLRNDGIPKSGQKKPDDPGVAVYFKLDGKDVCIPCDRWIRVEDNIASVASVLKAIRAIERHGNEGMISAAFKGFAALPAPDQIYDWHITLGVSPAATAAQINEAYRKKAKEAHKDAGGNDAAMTRLNTARDFALKAVTAA